LQSRNNQAAIRRTKTEQQVSSPNATLVAIENEGARSQALTLAEQENYPSKPIQKHLSVVNNRWSSTGCGLTDSKQKGELEGSYRSQRQ
jgi:hypothetical protein